VLVFRLSDGKCLGGFAFDAENGPINSLDTMDHLKDELFQNYLDALASRSKAYAPGLDVRYEIAGK
jgi:hypothetical protein